MMRWTSRGVVIMTVSTLLGSPSANAQRLGLGQQMMPGVVVPPSPVYRGYDQPPTYPQAPAYRQDGESSPSYQQSSPRYLPHYGGGAAGSTFSPRR